MPFGLTNAPAVFQSMINNVLRDFLDHLVYVYFDDTLIYSPDQNRLKPCDQSFKKTVGASTLCQSQSAFHANTISFVGLIVAPGIVQMDPAKINAVAEWPAPDSRKKVKQFLGFANFYRRFIKGFSALAAPLHVLTSSQVQLNWTPEAETAFETLERHFTLAPFLTMPDLQRQFIVKVDASNKGVGAVLSKTLGAG